jgi:hypothetical protein
VALSAVDTPPAFEGAVRTASENPTVAGSIATMEER